MHLSLNIIANSVTQSVVAIVKAKGMHASVCGAVWAVALASLWHVWPPREVPEAETTGQAQAQSQSSMMVNIYCYESFD